MDIATYIAYYRVSTRKQQKSGLGVEAQQAAVREHLKGAKPFMQFTETESGKRNNRPVLAEALAECRATGATLVIAKLDRLARNMAFIANLQESGVEFTAADMPTASRFTVHIMAAVAEQEAVMIAARTKAAMATAKARGTLLGRRDDKIAAYAKRGAQVSALVRSSKAQKRADNLIPAITRFKREGATTLRQIAAALNKGRYKTARGGKWSAEQVRLVLKKSHAA
jgi:DNA invertase Pin-like site-specific DNA recombinase